MGLDTTHNCWHGPYSSFQAWRNKVAEAAGYEIKYQDGLEMPVVDQEHLTNAQAYGEWEETPSDPLLVLIWHSDCDGVIHPSQAAALGSRLIDLEPKMDSGTAYIANQFIHGLLIAAAHGEDVEFG